MKTPTSWCMQAQKETKTVSYEKKMKKKKKAIHSSFFPLQCVHASLLLLSICRYQMASLETENIYTAHIGTKTVRRSPRDSHSETVHRSSHWHTLSLHVQISRAPPQTPRRRPTKNQRKLRRGWAARRQGTTTSAPRGHFLSLLSTR